MKKLVFLGIIFLGFLSCQEELNFDPENQNLSEVLDGSLKIEEDLTDATLLKDESYTITLTPSCNWEGEEDGGAFYIEFSSNDAFEVVYEDQIANEENPKLELFPKDINNTWEVTFYPRGNNTYLNIDFQIIEENGFGSFKSHRLDFSINDDAIIFHRIQDLEDVINYTGDQDYVSYYLLSSEGNQRNIELTIDQENENLILGEPTFYNGEETVTDDATAKGTKNTPRFIKTTPIDPNTITKTTRKVASSTGKGFEEEEVYIFEEIKPNSSGTYLIITEMEAEATQTGETAINLSANTATDEAYYNDEVDIKDAALHAEINEEQIAIEDWAYKPRTFEITVATTDESVLEREFVAYFSLSSVQDEPYFEALEMNGVNIANIYREGEEIPMPYSFKEAENTEDGAIIYEKKQLLYFRTKTEEPIDVRFMVKDKASGNVVNTSDTYLTVTSNNTPMENLTLEQVGTWNYYANNMAYSFDENPKSSEIEWRFEDSEEVNPWNEYEVQFSYKLPEGIINTRINVFDYDTDTQLESEQSFTYPAFSPYNNNKENFYFHGNTQNGYELVSDYPVTFEVKRLSDGATKTFESYFSILDDRIGLELRNDNYEKLEPLETHFHYELKEGEDRAFYLEYKEDGGSNSSLVNTGADDVFYFDYDPELVRIYHDDMHNSGKTKTYIEPNVEYKISELDGLGETNSGFSVIGYGEGTTLVRAYFKQFYGTSSFKRAYEELEVTITGVSIVATLEARSTVDNTGIERNSIEFFDGNIPQIHQREEPRGYIEITGTDDVAEGTNVYYTLANTTDLNLRGVIALSNDNEDALNVFSDDNSTNRQYLKYKANKTSGTNGSEFVIKRSYYSDNSFESYNGTSYGTSKDSQQTLNVVIRNETYGVDVIKEVFPYNFYIRSYTTPSVKWKEKRGEVSVWKFLRVDSHLKLGIVQMEKTFTLDVSFYG